MDLVVASNNLNKIKEFKSIFKDTEFNIISMKEIGCVCDIVEDGNTFIENAAIKAKYITNNYNVVAISDDSGLEVKALNNAPGIYSARYAGEHKSDSDNNELLVLNMQDKKDMSARYVCAICMTFPNGDILSVEDYCNGLITLSPKGEFGFGYDPYFYIEESNKTMAEMTLEEKNKISHRAKALAKMINKYKEYSKK